jgi:hypothetical protein
MSVLDTIFGGKNRQIKELEDRVTHLEAIVRQMSEVIRDVTALSFQTGVELESLVNQLRNMSAPPKRKIDDIVH